MSELCGQNFIESLKTVEVQVGRPSLQVHGKYQSGEPKIVIAVKMTDENMVDLENTEPIPCQLHLAAFTTVDKEVLVLNGEVLGRGKSSVCRQCAAGAQNGKCEGQYANLLISPRQ